MLEVALLAAVAALQVTVLVVLLYPARTPVPPLEPVDLSPFEVDGPLPDDLGSYRILGGLTAGDPVLHSGVITLEVLSKTVWVFEVWVRTDHGWMQLQPSSKGGMFRNFLAAGHRISAIRLWLADVGHAPDERPLRDAAGLLVPAAVLLSRANPTGPVAPARANQPVGHSAALVVASSWHGEDAVGRVTPIDE